MDTSYLAQQVNTIIGQLHGLFDEIGVAHNDREHREAELFAALSEALQNQVRRVTNEKQEMIEEAQKIITTIRQMEMAMDDTKKARRSLEDDGLKVTYPLIQCIQGLQEKHCQVARAHRERYEEIKKLAQALESYSLHLEPGFVRLELPPTGPDQPVSTTFDLTDSYVQKLDEEFTRVFEEYTRRVAAVKSVSEEIIQLWAELGTPQAQTDGAIVKYYRDAPEQLGLHQVDIERLRAKKDKLADEKQSRENRLTNLKATVGELWEKLGVDESARKAFLNSNRGCGMRQINEFEDELSRLNELKRQNMHIFIEDARVKLQGLWDALYYSEDEMLEFTPAFSDVYSDALLEAHEREIARLETLKEQRAPLLSLVDKYKSLVADREELAASSQDASRLLMKGQKGERRDPGKLLREEKMRKRIAKELPKVIVDLRKSLEQWEEEYGRPFLVQGERFLDAIEEEDPKVGLGTSRPKTPGVSASAVKPRERAATLNRANSAHALRGQPPKSPTKTPSASTSALPARSATVSGKTGSPTRLPARAPLSNLTFINSAPADRITGRPESRVDGTGSLRGAPLLRAPPPKMRSLLPPPDLEKPNNPYNGANLRSSITLVREVEAEDMYDDRGSSRSSTRPGHSNSISSHTSRTSHSSLTSYTASQSSFKQLPQAPPPRQTADRESAGSAVSESENWQTYEDGSDLEEETGNLYLHKVRGARSLGGFRRSTPDDSRPQSHASQHSQSQHGFGQLQQAAQIRAMKQSGLQPPAHAGRVALVDADGDRIMGGQSEWADEDGYSHYH
ncbi:microtubule associated protein-domain-containing protein [Pseudoneurospora amorphoporcata]|uniref:Microtubule associated protein-domain-containing protein n=1 Tax=Pseudoneurospora amorphoporcata TaxID=241081 RepID=A0AAN6P243_9PEZI|nr:microtubule associated protein-domain-containing protein [Pseudoneurospora amorphoporcata]